MAHCRKASNGSRIAICRQTRFPIHNEGNLLRMKQQEHTMPNLHRGEIEAEIGGTRRRLVLTLGALAELEAAFGADDLTALAERRQPRWRGDVRSRARVGKRADIRAGVSAVHPCLIRHK